VPLRGTPAPAPTVLGLCLARKCGFVRRLGGRLRGGSITPAHNVAIDTGKPIAPSRARVAPQAPFEATRRSLGAHDHVLAGRAQGITP